MPIMEVAKLRASLPVRPLDLAREDDAGFLQARSYFFSADFSTGILNCSGRSRSTRRSQASG